MWLIPVTDKFDRKMNHKRITTNPQCRGQLLWDHSVCRSFVPSCLFIAFLSDLILVRIRKGGYFGIHQRPEGLWGKPLNLLYSRQQLPKRCPSSTAQQLGRELGQPALCHVEVMALSSSAGYVRGREHLLLTLRHIQSVCSSTGLVLPCAFQLLGNSFRSDSFTSKNVQFCYISHSCVFPYNLSNPDLILVSGSNAACCKGHVEESANHCIINYTGSYCKNFTFCRSSISWLKLISNLCMQQTMQNNCPDKTTINIYNIYNVSLKLPLVFKWFMTLDSVLFQSFYFLTTHHKYCDVTQPAHLRHYYEAGSRLRANVGNQSSLVPVLLESRFTSFDLTLLQLFKPFRDAFLSFLMDLKIFILHFPCWPKGSPKTFASTCLDTKFSLQKKKDWGQ